MNSYQTGMGFSTAQSNGGTPVNQMQNAGPINANFATTGGLTTGLNAQPGVLALILLTAGLVVFYFTTRKIQGSLS
jgi:hypothetical protein